MPANKPTFDHIDFASPHGIHFVLEMRRFPSGVIFQFRDRYIEIIRSYDSKLINDYASFLYLDPQSIFYKMTDLDQKSDELKNLWFKEIDYLMSVDTNEEPQENYESMTAYLAALMTQRRRSAFRKVTKDCHDLLQKMSQDERYAGIQLGVTSVRLLPADLVFAQGALDDWRSVCMDGFL